MAKDSKKQTGIVTQKEVAKALGLSVMTVSRALSNRPNVNSKTRKLILETAREMGYSPNHLARSLVSSRTYTIGVVIPEISHAFFPEVVRGIEEIANESDYQIFLTNSAENFEREKKAIEALRAKRVDGILISTSLVSAEYSYFQNLVESGLPIVFFDRCIYDLGISCIGVNDRSASKQITEHVIEKGYKRIAYLSGPAKVSIGKERLNGFLDAMKNQNLQVVDKLIIESGFTEEGGKKAMEQILTLPKSEQPEAVVSVNDPAAFGAMEAISEAGMHIPEDVAVVGFTDDIRARLVTPPLTTIRQPAYEVGKRAISKLIRLIENENEPVENIEITANLVVRNSCGNI